MEGGLGFQVNSIDADRLTAYLEKGKIPIWDGVAVTTYLSFPLLSPCFLQSKRQSPLECYFSYSSAAN